MKDEIVYMLGVLATVFAVNYLLRALPFIIFPNSHRALPGWVAKFGRVISPIIFAGLIVYCYAGLQWKTAWPYVAGAVTVALQIWRRNALVSIVAGTVLYMLLLGCCGCATTHREIQLDGQHPSIRLSRQGVHFGTRRVTPDEVVEILDDFDVSREQTIHIRIDNDVTDLRPARALMGRLGEAGYTSPILVTERHAESRKIEKRNPWAAERVW